MYSQEDFFDRVAEMSEENKTHFVTVIKTLAMCYGEEDASCVIVFSSPKSSLAQVLTLNCNDMEAAALVATAHKYLTFVNTRDAPPKEKFN